MIEWLHDYKCSIYKMEVFEWLIDWWIEWLNDYTKILYTIEVFEWLMDW